MTPKGDQPVEDQDINYMRSKVIDEQNNDNSAILTLELAEVEVHYIKK